MQDCYNLKINGKPEKICGKNISDILSIKGVEPRMVVVELNSALIERNKYEVTEIKDGDIIELVFFMGGGSYDL